MPIGYLHHSQNAFFLSCDLGYGARVFEVQCSETNGDTR